jgi:hypothetical protein
LARIVVNACRDRQRYERRRPSTPLEPESDDGYQRLPLPDSGESPEHFAERADQRKMLEYALGQLSDEHRIVVLLDHVGFNYADISSILGIEVGTVKSRLSRARSRLRDILTNSAIEMGSAQGYGPLASAPTDETPNGAEYEDRTRNYGKTAPSGLGEPESLERRSVDDEPGRGTWRSGAADPGDDPSGNVSDSQ